VAVSLRVKPRYCFNAPTSIDGAITRTWSLLAVRPEQLAGINRLLEGMRSGQAGSLVLRGEAGIGKTALLDAAEEKAAGARVLRRCR
jgi:DNA replication protein DnaC